MWPVPPAWVDGFIMHMYKYSRYRYQSDGGGGSTGDGGTGSTGGGGGGSTGGGGGGGGRLVKIETQFDRSRSHRCHQIYYDTNWDNLPPVA